MNTTLKTTLRLSPIGLIASAILVVGCVAPAGAGANAALPANTTQVSKAASEQTFDEWGHIGHVTPQLTTDQWGHVIYKAPEQTVDQWGHIGHKTPVLVMDQWGHISER